LSISDLRELLTLLREFNVSYYKAGDLELGFSEPEEPSEPTNAIGFVQAGQSGELDDEPDPLAKLRGRLNPAYFDPSLGLVAK